MLSDRVVNVSEDAGSITLYAVLSDGLESPLKVNVTTANNTARAGQDYDAINTTLVFDRGVTSLPITIVIRNDGLYSDPDKNFTVRLSGLTGTASWGIPITATISLVETSPRPTLALEQSGYEVGESAGRVRINVTLSGGVSSRVYVNVSTLNGTAVAGTNFGRVAARLAFNPGERTKTVTIAIRNDTIYHPSDGNFFLNFTDVTGQVLYADPLDVTVTIREGSACPAVRLNRTTYTVRENAGTLLVGVLLSGRTDSPVVVNYSLTDGTAIEGRDYEGTGASVTIDPGLTSAWFAVRLIDDGAYGYPNKYFYVNMTDVSGDAAPGTQKNASVMIIETNSRPALQFDSSAYYIGEDWGNIMLNVTLSGPADAPVSVNYTTANRTARAGINFVAANGTLVFDPGVTSLPVTVALINDSLYCYPDRNFTVRLSGVSGPASMGLRSVATVNLYEMNAVPLLSFELGEYTAGENAGTVRVNVTKTGSVSGSVRVNYSTGGGTALAGRDYVAGNGTLVFAPADTRKTITVQVLHDTSFNNNLAFYLNLSDSTGGTALGPNQNAMIRLKEVDPAPVVRFAAAGYMVNSTDGTATLVVEKIGRTAVNASVGYATVDDTALAGVNYVATAGTLTFLPDETSKTITVSLLSTPGTNSTFTVVLTSPDQASIGARDTAAVNIINSPLPVVQFSMPSWEASEDAGTVSMNITKAWYGACTVRLDTMDGTALAGQNYSALEDYQVEFNETDTYRTVEIPIADDWCYKATDTLFFINLSMPEDCLLGDYANTTVTIVDTGMPMVEFLEEDYEVPENATAAEITLVLRGTPPCR